jgi:uridine kinase
VSPERTAVLDLVAAAVTTAARDGRALIAVDGASGTGKSTFADELARTLETAGRSVVRASTDSFHRPRSERYRLGVDSPTGYYLDSHDLAALRHNLLQPFTAGAGSYRRAIFDEPSDRRIDEPAEPVPAAAILVFDGLFLLRPELVEFWNLSVFLMAESRREAAWDEYLTRDLPSEADQRAVEVAARIERARRRRYTEGQALYEQEARPRDYATIVIKNDDLVHPQVIAAR